MPLPFDPVRRALIAASLAGAIGGALGLRAPRARASGTRAPRYVIVLYLGGGLDAVYSLDPKERGEVAPEVEVPYGRDAIAGSAGVRLGPHFAPLLPWAGRMAVVRGVRVHTANHPTGSTQFVRFRTDAQPEMPSLLDIIGAHRDGQALGSVSLGLFSEPGVYSPGWFGAKTRPQGRPATDVFAELDNASPAAREAMGAWLERQARTLGASARTPEERQTVTNLRDTSAFFTRAAKAPPFRPQTSSKETIKNLVGTQLQRAVWLLEHDLTRSVLLQPGLSGAWDTHAYNGRFQALASGLFTEVFARMLTELSTRSNASGRLLDNTLVVAGSELGRFPCLNRLDGKDHFPEAPFLVMGPSINVGSAGHGAVFGSTGRHMEAERTSLKTGRADGTGAWLELDDLGATLLRLSGIDPEPYGYRGRMMEFLAA